MPQLNGKDKKPKSKKKKQPKIPPDLDELYIQSLDETHYISKSQRESITAAYMQRIDTAIKAFTIAQPPIETATLLEREEKISKEILAQIPMVAVPHIVRAVGLNPTTQQVLQIGWLVFAGLPQREEEKQQQQQQEQEKEDTQQKGKKKKKKSITGKNKNTTKTKGTEGTKVDGSPDSESAVRQMVVDTTRDMQLEEAMRAALSPDSVDTIPISTSTVIPTSGNATVTVTTGPSNVVYDAPLMADRQKLETLLLRILHTGLLVYDPLLTGHLPAAIVHPRRIVTLVRRGTQETIDDVFDALWVASRRYRCPDGTRYISTSELQHAMETTDAALAGVETALTSQELEAFLHFVCDTGIDQVREDTFALAAMCGC
ncbi:uncharacterized protein TM35_000251670 [Trypanosoma theileri]|uniref:Uncharacterized protein n=1 Tax=Trypanosoma theileri TaxID=67003 RepID=A0A1X0NQJ4_9TRYP|nr:uncharacterized protein TM35_000251670 [Trypanosoma theileri]ORC86871.1 hypothetical protein TM35_000251670 [Trypanosoma theileri]